MNEIKDAGTGWFQVMVVLLITSAWDWPWQVIRARKGWSDRLPAWPSKEDFYEEPESSWYHRAKNFWTELMERDARWWSKFCRFLIWWLTFFHLFF